jgi:hypothetical protein
MKIIAIILALAATMVAAIPASVGANLEAREPDCQTCFDKYDSCINVCIPRFKTLKSIVR